MGVIPKPFLNEVPQFKNAVDLLSIPEVIWHCRSET